LRDTFADTILREFQYNTVLIILLELWSTLRKAESTSLRRSEDGTAQQLPSQAMLDDEDYADNYTGHTTVPTTTSLAEFIR
jgi:hypothetical protein